MSRQSLSGPRGKLCRHKCSTSARINSRATIRKVLSPQALDRADAQRMLIGRKPLFIEKWEQLFQFFCVRAATVFANLEGLGVLYAPGLFLTVKLHKL